MANANEPPPSPEWSAPDTDNSYDSNFGVYSPSKFDFYSYSPSKEELLEEQQERADTYSSDYDSPDPTWFEPLD